MKKSLAVIGLGYVGLPLAVEFGKYRPVLGFDIDHRRVKELKDGLDATSQFSGKDLLDSSGLRFSSAEKELGSVDIFIITVPTPIDASNKPDLTILKGATHIVARNICVGSIVIFESTVYPGVTEDICVPVIEEVSGLKHKRDFFCGYSPERINPGDKVKTLTNIVKVVSGSTIETANIIEELYSEIIQAGVHRVSSIRVAEAAKVIENAQRDLNIAFVNELSMIFERLNIDTNEVLDAASTKWNFMPFKPGLVGGHCIGVDPYYLTFKAEEAGYRPEIILAGRRLNDSMARHCAQKIIQLMTRNGACISSSVIGILGLSFKENCPDIRNSKVLDMVAEFEMWGATTHVCDPLVDPQLVFSSYGIKLVPELIPNKYDAIVLAVPHDQFKSFNAEYFASMMKKEGVAVFGDLKSQYKKGDLEKLGFEVMRL